MGQWWGCGRVSGRGIEAGGREAHKRIILTR